jgi:hypothetical protein
LTKGSHRSCSLYFDKATGCFDDFIALAPEVNKINPGSSDLLKFWPWLQKSTKSAPEALIPWLSGLGSRSRQHDSQKFRFDDFDDFLALAPEIDKISTRSLALMIIWPWPQNQQMWTTLLLAERSATSLAFSLIILLVKMLAALVTISLVIL